MCRSENEVCKTCAGKDCNAKVHFQSCHICTSASSLNCIVNVNATATQTCRNYLDECFVHVVNNAVIRGCILENTQLTDDCKDPTKCEVCSDKANCNSNIVAADDFCYTCDSEKDSNCTANLNDSMLTQCPFSVSQMGCYRYDDGGNSNLLFIILVKENELQFSI